MLRKWNNPLFYLIFIVLTALYLIGIYFIFMSYQINPRLFIFIAFFAYPIVLLWEEHVERSVERRANKEKYFFNIISGEESRALYGEYSIYTLIGSGMVIALVLIFRFIYPENIDLESAIYAGCSLGIIIYLYKRRNRNEELIKQNQNIED